MKRALLAAFTLVVLLFAVGCNQVDQGVSDIEQGWSDAMVQGDYAKQYNIPEYQVHLYPKPQDCDFQWAPLGIKNCHYERKAFAYNATGQPINGAGALYQIMSNADHTYTGPARSLDNGKNWNWIPTEDFEHIKSIRDYHVEVYVYWTKMPGPNGE